MSGEEKLRQRVPDKLMAILPGQYIVGSYRKTEGKTHGKTYGKARKLTESYRKFYNAQMQVISTMHFCNTLP
jgi:hypothetical protein